MSAASTIVIFGASGDLTSRKLIPALFDNFRKGRLSPQTRIVGFARTQMDDEAFRRKLFTFAEETLGRDCDANCWRRFGPMIRYCPGDIGVAEDYERLGSLLREWEGEEAAGRLYYLAIAPQLYPEAIRQLGAVGMANQDHGWRRIIIEKPFGADLVSAKSLNAQVHAVFDEDQVYRIDHYLGKETVQNLLVFRFANTIFEPVWNRNYVDHVQITVSENVTVGERGGYYEKAGVLRDMFQ
ncbi:MAG: glucose-6-phosphate dehydrogenase, partial [Planctomycetes bacterium]|nr:glucose-6-phosphate dehydrogenase [Planctomycetota bacterium]